VSKLLIYKDFSPMMYFQKNDFGTRQNTNMRFASF
jgi:hypothetical protein